MGQEDNRVRPCHVVLGFSPWFVHLKVALENLSLSELVSSSLELLYQ